jgi:hypothetical protein
MSNLLKCDECGKTVVREGEDYDVGWYELFAEPESRFDAASGLFTARPSVDLCSVACLKAYVGKLK